MARITLKGNPINTIGNLPEIGEDAKDFELTRINFSRVNLSDYKGQKLILNIFPSIDTGTCAMSVRQFNKVAAGLENTKVLCISRDLPFAQRRFCGAEGIENVEMLSDFETGLFGKDYGLQIVDGTLKGLLSRSIVVLDENAVVKYTEQVAETSQEPDYEAALSHLV